jgi:hypothetical protein
MTATKDQIRAAIFSGKTSKVINVKAFDTALEVRQPALGDILGLQDIPDHKTRVVMALINYCYVPGTGEKVFSVADKDIILQLPFDDNFTAVQNAIAELTGVNLDAAKGNLEAVPQDTTS